jgi:large subunit ribosomal protein L30
MGGSERIKVKLVGSPIGQTDRQRKTLRGLGLTRLGRTVLVPDNPATRGMILKVQHLVKVES